MPIVIVDNFDVNVGKNVDSRYGPYATVGQANGAISSAFRYKGLTVLITGSGQNIEYWYSPTIGDGDLVPKTATIDTGSLLTTSSFNSWTGSSTSQFAGTASYASNGGVTQILQGTGIVLSPNPGVGSVTISATGGGGAGGVGQNVTSSFGNSTTWTFTHGLGTMYPVIQVLDNSHSQIIPEKVQSIDANTTEITFPTQESGYAIATTGGATASYIGTLNQNLIISGNIIPAGPYTNNTSSYNLGSPTAAWDKIYVSNNSLHFVSGALSSSIGFNNGVISFNNAIVNLPSSSTVPTASIASTASFITTLNQNVIITGSVAIGTGSVGNGENNLLLGPAPAGGSGEGGQLGLLAAGGSYTSSSFIDNWQNQFRILRGPGASSNAGLMYMDLQTGNTQFVGAVTASAYSGLPNSWLHALRTSNQTIGSGTWASRDIVFDQVASNNFTYNSSTGIATLKANKTYRLTARLAWSAAGLYTLKFRVYNQTTSAYTGPTVELIQSPNGTYNVSDNTLEHILAVGASDIDISIRTTSDTNALTGEFIRGDLNTQLIIQQIA